MNKQTILLTDPDPQILWMLEVSLKKAGFQVRTATDGLEALEQIKSHLPDLIVTELHLPQLDGFQLIQRIRMNHPGEELPIIILSSSDQMADKIKALELGVRDFLTKPTYLNEILNRIHLVLFDKERTKLEQGVQSGDFSGSLQEMGIIDLLFMLQKSRQSGVVHLKSTEGEGRIYFKDGRMLDAEVDDLSGERAIFRIFLWSDGEYTIIFQPVEQLDMITLTTEKLLAKGLRHIEEWSYLLEKLPPLKKIFTLDFKRFGNHLEKIPEELNPLFSLFNGRLTLAEIIKDSGLEDLAILNLVHKLHTENLLIEMREVPTATTVQKEEKLYDWLEQGNAGQPPRDLSFSAEDEAKPLPYIPSRVIPPEDELEKEDHPTIPRLTLPPLAFSDTNPERQEIVKGPPPFSEEHIVTQKLQIIKTPTESGEQFESEKRELITKKLKIIKPERAGELPEPAEETAPPPELETEDRPTQESFPALPEEEAPTLVIETENGPTQKSFPAAPEEEAPALIIETENGPTQKSFPAIPEEEEPALVIETENGPTQKSFPAVPEEEAPAPFFETEDSPTQESFPALIKTPESMALEGPDSAQATLEVSPSQDKACVENVPRANSSARKPEDGADENPAEGKYENIQKLEDEWIQNGRTTTNPEMSAVDTFEDLIDNKPEPRRRYLLPLGIIIIAGIITLIIAIPPNPSKTPTAGSGNIARNPASVKAPNRTTPLRQPALQRGLVGRTAITNRVKVNKPSQDLNRDNAKSIGKEKDALSHYVTLAAKTADSANAKAGSGLSDNRSGKDAPSLTRPPDKMSTLAGVSPRLKTAVKAPAARLPIFRKPKGGPRRLSTRGNTPLQKKPAIRKAAAPRKKPAPRSLSKKEQERNLKEGFRNLKGGKYRRALMAFKIAQKYKPAIAFAGIGRTYYEWGKESSALRYIKKALKLGVTSAYLYVILGSIYQGRGLKAKARQVYLKYLKIAPRGKHAKDVKSMLKSL